MAFRGGKEHAHDCSCWQGLQAQQTSVTPALLCMATALSGPSTNLLALQQRSILRLPKPQKRRSAASAEASGRAVPCAILFAESSQLVTGLCWKHRLHKLWSLQGEVSDSDDGGHWKSVLLEAPVSLLGGRSNVVCKHVHDRAESQQQVTLMNCVRAHNTQPEYHSSDCNQWMRLAHESCGVDLGLSEAICND
eukprot:3563706-Amphidinium_carterae.1